MVRNSEGDLKAYHNVCRHRGTCLVEAPSGSGLKRILCPYHAWTYDLNGRLLGAPHMSEVEDFERSENGLIPVSLDEWRGFLFLNLSPQAESLKRALGDLPRRAQPVPVRATSTRASGNLRRPRQLEAHRPKRQRVLPLPRSPPATGLFDPLSIGPGRPAPRAGLRRVDGFRPRGLQPHGEWPNDAAHLFRALSRGLGSGVLLRALAGEFPQLPSRLRDIGLVHPEGPRPHAARSSTSTWNATDGSGE